MSGMAAYDVQVRQVSAADWSDLLVGSALTTTSFSGVDGVRYYFRVRGTDVAGNVEDWPVTYDTSTLVDTMPPTGGVTVNRGMITGEGAFDTCTSRVILALEAQDSASEFARTASASTALVFRPGTIMWPRRLRTLAAVMA